MCIIAFKFNVIVTHPRYVRPTGITIGDFVLKLLTSSGHEHLAVESIFGNLEKILEALIGHSKRTQQIIDRWSSQIP